MSTYPETIITEALFAHLATMPGLATLLQSSTSTPPIDYPNGPTFNPPKAADGTAKPYLRVQDISSPPEGIGISGDYTRRGGTFAVLLFWPRGTGVVAPKEVAAAIAARFSTQAPIERGTQRIRIRQEKPPDVKSEIIGDDIMSIPIDIYYDVLP